MQANKTKHFSVLVLDNDVFPTNILGYIKGAVTPYIKYLCYYSSVKTSVIFIPKKIQFYAFYSKNYMYITVSIAKLELEIPWISFN